MASTSRDDSRANFFRNLEFGKLVEATVANDLQGRSYWGVDGQSTCEPDWHKTIICQAQKWVYVGDNKDAWDYEVNCNSCSTCKYCDQCTDKPYSSEVIRQKHEIKGNKRTHMITLDEWGFEQYRTQNIFIELKQRLDDGRYINGWWHESKKKDRAEWYHFFQPVEFIEKGVTYGKPDRATDETIKAFKEDETISGNDTLVIAAPWGYILSIRKVDLERIIDELNPEYTKYKSGRIIPVDILLNRYRGKGVNYTPVFTEIGKTGKEVKGTSGKRWIPLDLRELFYEEVIQVYKTELFTLLVTDQRKIGKEHTTEQRKYDIELKKMVPDPKPHYIEAFYDDITKMEPYKKGGKAK